MVAGREVTETEPRLTWIDPRARAAAFGTTAAELVEEIELQVQGEVPKWLDGMYIRNGPGDYEKMKHLFDGYAMLAKTRFDNGRVFFSNR